MQEAGRREERHPSPSRMLDRTLGEKHAHQQAADKGGLLNSIFARGKNLLYNSPLRGLTSVRGKSAAHSSLELTSIATGALVSSEPVEGSHS
jgi:hypothetical protein